MIPQTLICHVYGENNSNLNQIRQVGLSVLLLVQWFCIQNWQCVDGDPFSWIFHPQISGANLVVHDSKSGSLETQVVVSGTPDKMRTAQSLIQAFILCGQTQL